MDYYEQVEQSVSWTPCPRRTHRKALSNKHHMQVLNGEIPEASSAHCQCIGQPADGKRITRSINNNGYTSSFPGDSCG